MIYNLADIIKYNLDKGLNFPKDSISYEYIYKYRRLNRINYRLGVPPVDYDLLRKIVLKKGSKLKLLPSKCLAIHLRLGDVIDETPKEKEILNIIRTNKLDKICDSCAIFYGFHNTLNKIESLKYIKKLKKELNLLNLTVDCHSGSVDNDFTLLSTANYYIAGYRGFGWLSASINSGNVFWDLHNPPFFEWVRDRMNIPECIRGYYYQRVISGKEINIGESNIRYSKFLNKKKELFYFKRLKNFFIYFIKLIYKKII